VGGGRSKKGAACLLGKVYENLRDGLTSDLFGKNRIEALGAVLEGNGDEKKPNGLRWGWGCDLGRVMDPLPSRCKASPSVIAHPSSDVGDVGVGIIRNSIGPRRRLFKRPRGKRIWEGTQGRVLGLCSD